MSCQVLDGAIVVTSLISLIAKDVDGLSVFRSLRALRTLRPLRVVQRFPGLRKVVNSLFRAVPECINLFQAREQSGEVDGSSCVHVCGGCGGVCGGGRVVDGRGPGCL